MKAEVYELIALAMRYVFAGLMLLIVLRGWRISVVDSARARRLRRLSPDTGLVGEIMILDGAGKGTRCAVTLEGCIGSSRGADIRLRASTVRARHAIYLMTEDGLFVRGHAGMRIRDAQGRMRRELLVKDGERFGIGGVQMMLVLSDAGETPEELNRSVLYRPRHEGHEDGAREAHAQRMNVTFDMWYGDEYDALFDVKGCDDAQYGARSARDDVQYDMRSAHDDAQYDMRSAHDDAQYDMRSAREDAQYGMRSGRDDEQYDMRSARDDAQYDMRSARDDAQYGARPGYDASVRRDDRMHEASMMRSDRMHEAEHHAARQDLGTQPWASTSEAREAPERMSAPRRDVRPQLDNPMQGGYDDDDDDDALFDVDEED